jgi:TRAP-type uncharacterized transport system fused permease subunit
MMAQDKKFKSPADLKEDMDEISKYDPEVRFRAATGIVLKLTFAMTLVLSIFHIYTAGFGVLQEWRHRAFHLSFVLPLVYFLYSMRRGVKAERKHLYYDMIYAAIGCSVFTAMFRELWTLSSLSTLLAGVLSFLVILFFKRRELLQDRIFLYVDLLLFSAMIVSILWGANYAFHHIDFNKVFRDPNKTLIFWSAFLFVTFLRHHPAFFSAMAAGGVRARHPKEIFVCTERSPLFRRFFRRAVIGRVGLYLH